VPYDVAPLRSSATYPDDVCVADGLVDRFERKRSRGGEGSDEINDGVYLEADEHFSVKKDSPN
jgi:hypothetical protein